jgi:hypothetical protein
MGVLIACASDAVVNLARDYNHVIDVWQLQRHPVFAPLIAVLAGHAQAYLQQLGFDHAKTALHIQRCWPVLSEAGQVVGRHHHPNA